MSYKILIIEDDKEIRDILIQYLKREGYEVLGEGNGIDGLVKFNSFKPHLVILDIMMEGIDGFQVLEQIRLTSDIPVLMLTAKNDEVDRLKGFDTGADDYVSKPFSPREIVKRVETILRRIYGKKEKLHSLKVGQLVLDLDTEKLYKNKEEIEITNKEFLILKTFFENKGKVFTREDLITSAFGYDYEGFDRNIDTFIKKLRKKIERDHKNPKYIKTKYGAGYIFGGDRDEY